MDLQKRTWAEVDLDSILYNYNRIRERLPDGCRFLGVVKADAYGHGAAAVSRVLEKAGADYLAVSCLDEALELRRAGITMPVLILGHTPMEYVPLLIENGLTQTVTCEAKALEYSKMADALGKTLKIHIKLDTGMSRLGFLCAGEHFEGGVQNVIRSCSLPGLYPEGIYTHFAASDSTDSDSREYTLSQLELFHRFLNSLEKSGNLTFPIRHCANSGAVVNYPQACLDMVRPGLLLYGYGDGGALGLRPCMRLLTNVSTIKIFDEGTCVSYGRVFRTGRKTRMGILPIGYADGLLRSLSNRCSFATAYGMAPQRGRICMDMCMVDLTELPQVNLESQVEIFGKNSSIETLSDIAGTIPYEFLCSISKRVPRVYLSGGVPVSD